MNAATPDPAPTPELPGTPGELKRVLEAVLLSAKEPLSLGELRKVFDDRIGADMLRVPPMIRMFIGLPLNTRLQLKVLSRQ